jgi:hypothetical protein
MKDFPIKYQDNMQTKKLKKEEIYKLIIRILLISLLLFIAL